METPWTILGLPGFTTDEKTIKRAYHRAMRKAPPEGDPEAFARVRSAYEAALAQAKDGVESPTGDPHLDELYRRLMRMGSLDRMSGDALDRFAQTFGAPDRNDWGTRFPIPRSFPYGDDPDDPYGYATDAFGRPTRGARSPSGRWNLDAETYGTDAFDALVMSELITFNAVHRALDLNAWIDRIPHCYKASVIEIAARVGNVFLTRGGTKMNETNRQLFIEMLRGSLSRELRPDYYAAAQEPYARPPSGVPCPKCVERATRNGHAGQEPYRLRTYTDGSQRCPRPGCGYVQHPLPF